MVVLQSTCYLFGSLPILAICDNIAFRPIYIRTIFLSGCLYDYNVQRNYQVKSPFLSKIFFISSFILTIALFGWPGTGVSSSIPAGDAISAPEFTQTSANDWLNSKPLTLESLRGNVVLIDFWTFGCWNCYRSFPWLNDMEERLKDRGLVVIGVHTPEFDHEKNPDAVSNKIEEFGLQHAVMIDNDMTYWRAMKNRYWPAYYLIDKQGRIRGKYVGETHTGDKRATEIEQLITKLLKE